MDLATKELGTVHCSDSSVGIFGLVECDESETSWLAAVGIVHDLRLLNLFGPMKVEIIGRLCQLSERETLSVTRAQINSETYATVLAESVLEVAVGGFVAQARDVKVVAWVVVTTVTMAAVSTVIGWIRMKG